jgi:hypothetical protein
VILRYVEMYDFLLLLTVSANPEAPRKGHFPLGKGAKSSVFQMRAAITLLVHAVDWAAWLWNLAV